MHLQWPSSSDVPPPAFHLLQITPSYSESGKSQSPGDPVFPGYTITDTHPQMCALLLQLFLNPSGRIMTVDLHIIFLLFTLSAMRAGIGELIGHCTSASSSSDLVFQSRSDASAIQPWCCCLPGGRTTRPDLVPVASSGLRTVVKVTQPQIHPRKVRTSVSPVSIQGQASSLIGLPTISWCHWAVSSGLAKASVNKIPATSLLSWVPRNQMIKGENKLL